MEYANHLVCQYLRAKNYNGLLWGMIAGPLDSDFIKLVDVQIPYMYELYDPKNKMALDVPHFASSLDSTLYFFGSTDGYKADFAGWAGDLITVTGDAVSEGNASVYDAAMALIGNTMRGSFTLVDLLADADAFNIGYILERMVRPINDLVKDYYQNLYKNRFSLFFDNRFAGDSNKVVTDCMEFLTSKETIVAPMREIFINHFNVSDFSDEQAADVARAFKDTLLKKVSEE